MKITNKKNYQPSTRMMGRDILGRRNKRLQYIMKYKEVEPLVDEEMSKRIQSAWEKIKTPAIGYCTYRDVAKELKMTVGRLMQYLKGMHLQNPYSVRFQVNRMGDNVYFKLPTIRERKEAGE